MYSLLPEIFAIIFIHVGPKFCHKKSCICKVSILCRVLQKQVFATAAGRINIVNVYQIIESHVVGEEKIDQKGTYILTYNIYNINIDIQYHQTKREIARWRKNESHEPLTAYDDKLFKTTLRMRHQTYRVNNGLLCSRGDTTHLQSSDRIYRLDAQKQKKCSAERNGAQRVNYLI